MILVVTYANSAVAVLGIGRSGLSATHALRADRAEVIDWDDGAAFCAAAEVEGIALPDLAAAEII